MSNFVDVIKQTSFEQGSGGLVVVECGGIFKENGFFVPIKTEYFLRKAKDLRSYSLTPVAKEDVPFLIESMKETTIATIHYCIDDGQNEVMDVAIKDIHNKFREQNSLETMNFFKEMLNKKHSEWESFFEEELLKSH